MISPKAQLFKAPNICNVITWSITLLFLFMLSILLDQFSKVVSTRLVVYTNNLPLDIAKNIEFSNKTSSITKSVKNMLTSVDMAENIKFYSGSNNIDNKTAKKSSFSKRLNVSIRNFIFLYSNASSILVKRWAYVIILIITIEAFN